MKLKATIVDDEALARERIRTLLAPHDDIAIAGEYASGSEAVRAIGDDPPELLFLDIQMPGMDGFEVLRAIGPATIPAVIFVTAHNEHAVQAFEFMALDYLLKPFTEDRFRQSLQRARDTLSRPAELQEQLRGLLDQLKQPFLKRLVVRDAGRIAFVAVSEIRWIEAQGNYVRLHTSGESHLLRQSMQALEARLDPASYLRVHRSAIVNMERVRELRSRPHGDYTIVLDDGTEVASNRGFRTRLEQFLNDRQRT